MRVMVTVWLGCDLYHMVRMSGARDGGCVVVVGLIT